MPVQAFLEKPFKPGELLSEIQQLLALRDSVKEKGMGRILVVDDDPDFAGDHHAHSDCAPATRP